MEKEICKFSPPMMPILRLKKAKDKIEKHPINMREQGKNQLGAVILLM